MSWGSFSKIWKVKIINEKRIWTGMLTLNSTLVFGNGGRRQAGLTTQFFSASFSLYCLFFRFILACPLLYVLSKFPMKPEFKGLALNWIQNYWKCLNTSQKLRRKDSLIFLNVGIHGLSHHLKTWISLQTFFCLSYHARKRRLTIVVYPHTHLTQW